MVFSTASTASSTASAASSRVFSTSAAAASTSSAISAAASGSASSAALSAAAQQICLSKRAATSSSANFSRSCGIKSSTLIMRFSSYAFINRAYGLMLSRVSSFFASVIESASPMIPPSVACASSRAPTAASSAQESDWKRSASSISSRLLSTTSIRSRLASSSSSLLNSNGSPLSSSYCSRQNVLAFSILSRFSITLPDVSGERNFFSSMQSEITYRFSSTLLIPSRISATRSRMLPNNSRLFTIPSSCFIV